MQIHEIIILTYGFSWLYLFILEPLFYTFKIKEIKSYSRAFDYCFRYDFWLEQTSADAGAIFFVIFIPFVLVFLRIIKIFNVFKLARYIRDSRLQKQELLEESQKREEDLLQKLELKSRQELDEYLQQQI